MRTKNPQETYMETPEKLSEFSHIEDIEYSASLGGVIFDSVKELGDGIRLHGGVHPLHSEIMHGLMEDSYQQNSIGPAVVGLATSTLEGEQGDRFIEELVSEVETTLKEKGHFYRDFEWTLNAFDHHTVEGRRIGEKYVLNLFSTSDYPEERIAEALQKPRAWSRVDAKLEMDIVDWWWFNIKPGDALENLNLPSEDKEKLVDYLLESFRSLLAEDPEVGFSHQGKEYKVGLSLDAHTSLSPQNDVNLPSYFQVRGDTLVGGAWTIYDGEKMIRPRPEPASLVVSVSLPLEKYGNRPAVTEEEKEGLFAARNYLTKSLKA